MKTGKSNKTTSTMENCSLQQNMVELQQIEKKNSTIATFDGRKSFQQKNIKSNKKKSVDQSTQVMTVFI